MCVILLCSHASIITALLHNLAYRCMSLNRSGCRRHCQEFSDLLQSSPILNRHLPKHDIPRRQCLQQTCFCLEFHILTPRCSLGHVTFQIVTFYQYWYETRLLFHKKFGLLTAKLLKIHVFWMYQPRRLGSSVILRDVWLCGWPA
jgi:hypothetical protein